MTGNAILLPVLALVGWTFGVLMLIPYHRFKAAHAGRVRADDFKFGESSKVPPEVSIPNRNLINLLEIPVLFYVVCLIAYVSQHVDGVAVFLAWGFVGFRVLHSVVHLSYNKVFHRLSLYAVSNGFLVVLWMRLLIQIAQ